MDFYTGKAEVDRDELENIPPEPKNVWESMFTHTSAHSYLRLTSSYRDLVRDCMMTVPGLEP